MRTLAHEFAAHYTRVNTVHPTTVNTDMVQNSGVYQLFRPDLDAPSREDAAPVFAGLNLIPVPWVEPADISHAVVFLASDDARNITGATLPVDAGYLAR